MPPLKLRSAGPHERSAEDITRMEAGKREFELKLTDYVVDDPGVSSALDTVYAGQVWEEVKKIYARQLRRSTGKTRVPNLVPRSRIILTNEAGFRAVEGPLDSEMSYLPHANLILINVPHLRKGTPVGMPFVLHVASRLLHEQSHASDHYSETMARSGHQVINVGISQLSGSSKSSNAYAPSLELFYEVATEKRTTKVMAEMLERVSLPGITKDHEEKLVRGEWTYPEYLIGFFLIDAISERIANTLHIPIAKVWGRIVTASILGLAVGQKQSIEALGKLIRIKPEILKMLIRISITDASKLFVFIEFARGRMGCEKETPQILRSLPASRLEVVIRLLDEMKRLDLSLKTPSSSSVSRNKSQKQQLDRAIKLVAVLISDSFEARSV